MNKNFIILLAVCLVSVHAFVKREAESKPAETFEGVKKQVEDTFNNIQEGLKELLDPEVIKKNFGNAVDGINKAITDLQSKHEEPKA